MDAPYYATDDIIVLPTHLDLPGLGVLPTNAFLMHGRDPVLVGTGPASQRDAFLTALSSLLDPARLSWIFLTSEDRDQTGNLQELLRLAPRARVVTTFFALAALAFDGGLPSERVRLVVPGSLFTANGRTWRAVKPPVFGAPSAVAFFDREEANLFSGDCFGAVLPHRAEFADELPRDQLGEGMAFLARATAGWLPMVDGERFEAAVDAIRELAPVTILSGHGPVLRDLALWACDEVSSLAGLDPLPEVDDLRFRQLLDAERRAA